jgi:membrane associated rhomboid family serine protease
MICGLADNLLLAAVVPNSFVTTLGASSAISGLMGMYFCFFSWVKIDMEVWCLCWDTGYKLSVPAFLLIPLWILLQFLLTFTASTNVFYLGHVIGALTGIILGQVFVRLGVVERFWMSLDERYGARGEPL